MKMTNSKNKDGLTAKERVCAEKAALEKKIVSLKAALDNKDFMMSRTRTERALLTAQYSLMQDYCSTLEARLAIWRD